MIKHQQNFAFGLAATLIGVLFALGAQGYSIGRAAHMGAGFFPFYVACILIILGLGITLGSLGRCRQKDADIEKLRVRPLIFILLANVLFGVLLVGLPSIGLPSMGLLLAVFVTVVVAAMAGQEFVWREVLVLALIMVASCYVLFVQMLDLTLPVLPSFFN